MYGITLLAICSTLFVFFQQKTFFSDIVHCFSLQVNNVEYA